jgi:hypothetical protein
MYYVGLGIHQRSTSMEILDCNPKLVKRGELGVSGSCEYAASGLDQPTQKCSTIGAEGEECVR